MQTILGFFIGIAICANVMVLAINHGYVTDIKTDKVLIEKGCGVYIDGVFKFNSDLEKDK